MQVILRTDIENLGKLGDIVEVKPGYARNFLIPKQMAMLATPGNKKVFEQQRRKLQEALDKARRAAQNMAEKLEELVLEIPVRVGENDKLYGSVTTAHIANALAEKGFEVDKKKVELDKPIRSLGEFSVGVRLYPHVCPQVKVQVIRHDEEGHRTETGEEE
jgi:large subunit ribosomal protein L9